MFASALQKRKAVVLSQSQTQQQQQTRPQLQQQQQRQLAQPRAAAPVAHTPVSTTRTAASPHAAAVGRTTAATSTANASQQRSASSASTGTSLSAMLSKRQKTEAPLAHNAASQSAAMSSFTTARPMTEAERLQPTAATAASTATKVKAKARVLPTKSRTATRKTQQSSSSEQTVDGVVIELSPKRRVTVRLWRAAVLIDIREYYDDNGVAKPGKKGISLSQDQWQSLLRLAPAIDEAIVLVDDDSVDAHSLEDVPERLAAASTERTITFTLSSKRRISVRSFRSAVLIDLREFYDDDNGVSRPGKKGIALSKDQWRALCVAQQQVTDAASQL